MENKIENNILPLGSVIKIDGGDEQLLMVIARGSVIQKEDEEVYYDYCGVLVPQGMVTTENTYFFNIEQVGEVVFRGFENDTEISFQESYANAVASIDMKKGEVKYRK